MKPQEIDELPMHLLPRIVIMEARAKPRLTDIDGLWRKGCKGTRGSVARPGSITEYIRQRVICPRGRDSHLGAILLFPERCERRAKMAQANQHLAKASKGEERTPTSESWPGFFYALALPC